MGKNLTIQTSPVDLLWTGGWDSTFRLLQLLIQENKTVQPHYLVDADRISTGAELLAMRNIKQAIFSRYPDTKERLYATKIADIYDLPPDQTISDSLIHIKEHHHLGSQYDWLARYCETAGLQNIELAAEEGGFLSQVIEPMIHNSSQASEGLNRVDQGYQGTDEYNLFHWYSFPLIHLNKLEMKRIAWEAGLKDIMLMTWFCHRPGPNYTPCGLCRPCSLTIEEGLGWRVPLISRIKYYLVKNIRQILMLDKNPPIYQFARKIKNQIRPGARVRGYDPQQ